MPLGVRPPCIVTFMQAASAIGQVGWRGFISRSIRQSFRHDRAEL